MTPLFNWKSRNLNNFEVFTAIVCINGGVTALKIITQPYSVTRDPLQDSVNCINFWDFCSEQTKHEIGFVQVIFENNGSLILFDSSRSFRWTANYIITGMSHLTWRKDIMSVLVFWLADHLQLTIGQSPYIHNGWQLFWLALLINSPLYICLWMSYSK